MIVFLSIFLGLIIIALAVSIFLLTRAARRLLEFDKLWDDVTDVLLGYELDLRKMSSGDLSETVMDHPEILTFHRRNLKALSDIGRLTEDLKGRKPREEKLVGRRPVVE